MSRSAKLWEANLDWAERCLHHPFVQGIASGELPRERFVFYVGQDAFFLTAFARSYALSLAKAPTREDMEEYRQMLDDIFGELNLHDAYAAQWGVDLNPKPSVATLTYTDFVQRVAWSSPVGHTAAAVVPCMRLYAYLGQRLLPNLNHESPYKDWVLTYSSDEFEAAARRIERLLDKHDDGSEEIADLYRTAMEMEYAFFDQAWKWAE